MEQVIRHRAESDSRLFYPDRRVLLGELDSHLLYDNLHPNVEGYRLFGERFAAIANSAGSPLVRAFGMVRVSAGDANCREVFGLHYDMSRC